MGNLNENDLYKWVEQLSLKYFHKPFVDVVKFNNRLRTTGGRYLPAKRTIELNPKYVMECDEEEVNGILKHELCHYHLHIEGKGYNHGDQDFKKLLKETGSPRYCSQLPSAANRFNYIYQCKGCNHIYKRVRRVDLRKFRCGKCKGELVMNGQEYN